MTLATKTSFEDQWGILVFPQIRECNPHLRAQQRENNETEEVELTDETMIRGTPWSEIKVNMKKKDFISEWSTLHDRKLIRKLMDAQKA